MATTQNTYTGDGTTVLFSFTFPYIQSSDVKVSLDEVLTTEYTLANATTIEFNAAPLTGVAIRLFRETSDDDIRHVFYPGSAIRARDLNDNYVQNLYVTQEANFNVDTANTTANTAKTTADTALTNSAAAVTSANAAVTTANTADTNASAAVTTANAANATSTTAATDAASAVTTANTASTNASAAVTTANSAATDAASAITTANGAVTTANAATTTANTANTTAGNAVTTANSAVTTANTANTTAGSAVTTANSATSTANTANTNATNAVAVANAAAADVANAVIYTTVVVKADLEALTPTEDGYYQVSNSTGLANATWGIYTLSGIPSSYSTMTQLSGITTRLSYTHSTKTFAYNGYTVNDPEARYLTKNVPVVTGDSTNGSGQITLNCENNSHGIKIKGPPHSASATYTLTLPNDTGTSGNVLKTDGSGTTSWGSADVVNDATPQLGGNLDLLGHEIGSSSVNTDIKITAASPNKDIIIDAARHLTLKADSNGTNGEVQISGGPLSCAQITNVSALSGSTPVLRGQNGISGSAALQTMGSNTAGNPIYSELRLGADRLDMYFNGSHAIYMGTSGNFNITSANAGITFGPFSGGSRISFTPHANAGNAAYILPRIDGSADQVLTTDGSGNMSWSSSDVVSDTTPQLGGDLDVNGNNITNIDLLYGTNTSLRGMGQSGTTSLSTSGGSSVTSSSLDSEFRLQRSRLDLYFNSDLHLGMHQDGDLTVYNTTSTQRGIAFYGGYTNNFLRIKPPSSFTATTYYLPAADGSANSLLQTDGSGNMSWADFSNDPQKLTTKTVVEKALINSSGSATGTINLNVSDQAITWDSADATGNFVINVRNDASTTLDSSISNGQAVTVVYIVNYGATAYYPTSITVDGAAATVKWVGGAPTAAGTVNSITNYTLTIMKTATATFTVFASTNTYE